MIYLCELDDSIAVLSVNIDRRLQTESHRTHSKNASHKQVFGCFLVSTNEIFHTNQTCRTLSIWNQCVYYRAIWFHSPTISNNETKKKREETSKQTKLYSCSAERLLLIFRWWQSDFSWFNMSSKFWKQSPSKYSQRTHIFFFLQL